MGNSLKGYKIIEDEEDQPETSNVKPSSLKGYRIVDNEKDNEEPTNALSQFPSWLRTAITAFPGSPLTNTTASGKITPSQNIAAIKKGGQDIGEGIKQAYLSHFGAPGEEEQYTQQTEKGRRAYEETPGGKQGYANLLRENTATAPYALPIGGLIGATSMMGKLLAGAGSGALVGHTQYVKPNESRDINTLIGTGLGAAPEFPALASKMVSKLANAGGKKIANRVELDALNKQLEGAQAGLSGAEQQHQAQLESEKAIKNKVIEETGVETTPRLKRKINKTQENISNLDQNINDLSNQLQETKKLPEFPEVEAGHAEKAVQAQNALNEAEGHFNQAKETHGLARDALHETEKSIENHLNPGESHHLVVGKHIASEADKFESGVKKEYAGLVKSIKDNKFQMPSEQAQNYQENMDYYLQQLKSGVDPRKLKANEATTNSYLQHIIDKAPTIKDTQASTFLDKYKDFRDARYNLKKGLSSAKTAEERSQMIEALNQSEGLEKTVRDALHNGLGEYKDAFLKVNKDYGDVFNLRDNKVVRAARKEKKISPNNMMEQISGDAPGMEMVRGFVKNSPEAIKSIIGQRYEKKAANIYKPNKMTQEYLNETPQLNQLLKMRENAVGTVNRAKSNIEMAQEKHQLAQAEHTEASAKTKESTKIESDIGKEKIKREKEANDLQSKIDKHQESIKKDQDEIKKMQSNLSDMKKESAKTGLTFAEKAKWQKRIADTNVKIKEAKSNITSTQSSLYHLYKAVKPIINMGKRIIGI